MPSDDDLTTTSSRQARPPRRTARRDEPGERDDAGDRDGAGACDDAGERRDGDVAEHVPAARRRTSRVVAGLAAVGLVVVGVAVSRLAHPAADPVGDALYAAFVFALLVVVAPRARSATLAVIAFVGCAVVELAQLTGVPAGIVDAVPVARYALGTTFVAVDLLAYAVGAAAAWVVRR